MGRGLVVRSNVRLPRRTSLPGSVLKRNAEASRQDVLTATIRGNRRSGRHGRDRDVTFGIELQSPVLERQSSAPVNAALDTFLAAIGIGSLDAMDVFILEGVSQYFRTSLETQRGTVALAG